MSAKPHGIMFHHFHDDHEHIQGQGSIDQDQFNDMIDWLEERHNLLSAYEWYQRALQGSLRPDDICLTFDDNLKCQFDVALPVMQQRGLTAFWFVYTSPLIGVRERLEIYRYFRFSEFENIEAFYAAFDRTVARSKYAALINQGLKAYDADSYLREFPFYSPEDKKFRFVRDRVLTVSQYFELMDRMVEQSALNLDHVAHILWMNRENLQLLDAAGHLIGLHSHSHPTALAQLEYVNQHKEYQANHRILQSIVSQPIRTMSHPCNSYNSETLDILGDLNIQLGFRSNMADGDFSSLEYPRIDHALVLSQLTATQNEHHGIYQ
jgi:peptidoglycan/xylan/chitin deacetylase (PgdA/CDA1 family)